MFVPSFILSNVVSLSPKIDEIRLVVNKVAPKIAVFTETWLRQAIPDSVVNILGYNIFGKNRVVRTHGEVCVYIQNKKKVDILSNIISPSFEVLWLKLRPRKLPRGISLNILGAIYHPPGTPGSYDLAIIDYLIDSLTKVEAMYSNCGIVTISLFPKARNFNKNKPRVG